MIKKMEEELTDVLMKYLRDNGKMIDSMEEALLEGVTVLCTRENGKTVK